MAGASAPRGQKTIQLDPGAPAVRVCRGYAPPDFSLFSPKTLPAKSGDSS